MTSSEPNTEPRHFFERDGDVYTPTQRTRGPWDPKSMHGRVIAGLLVHVVERDHLDPDFQVARLTTDMFRVAPLAPVEVTTKVVRSGNRIRVVDASMSHEGTEIARASVVMLRKAEPPEGNVWSPPAWEVPHPDTIDPPQPRNGGDFVPMWETRPIKGGFGEFGQKRAWIRETVDLFPGEPSSPLVAAAQVADFVNPFANSGDAGLNYVNADLTLYLHRDPVGEWIGMEVNAHHASQGIAIGECAMYDLEGAFGRAAVCGVANQRRQER